MTYQQTLEYLYNRLPMFTRIGQAAYKADLGNTIALCDFLRQPQHQFKSIHIAGTNGKGSVSHSLAAILQQAGYKTGLYTSPHLKDFRERIRINGAMIPESFVIDFTAEMMAEMDRVQPSFFELTVAMAFAWFARQKVDIAVIETGLGGRLDSTNIISPLLSIITNIGYDHMHILGDTLELIAGEKAGIIKPDTPVIIGEVIPETQPVFENRAKAQQAPLVYAAEHRQVTDFNYRISTLDVDITDRRTGKTAQYSLDLPGLYQTKNILPILAAAEQLQTMGFTITDEHIKSALQQVKRLTGLHGRWECIRREPLVILDVAHNEDGIRQLLQQLALTPYRHLHIVMGMVKDKAVEKVLALLPVHATYYFTQANLPRALDAGLLAAKGAGFGLNGNSYPNVNYAIECALAAAGKADMVLVCGSIFVVGEVNDTAFGQEERGLK